MRYVSRIFQSRRYLPDLFLLRIFARAAAAATKTKAISSVNGLTHRFVRRCLSVTCENRIRKLYIGFMKHTEILSIEN